MGENKGQTIFLSVIGIATLLVAIIGATFAYFTSTNAGKEVDVDLTAKRVTGFSAEATGVTAGETILPGWSGKGSFSVSTDGATDVQYSYTCKIKATATGLTDMYVTVTDSTTNPAGSDIKVTSERQIASDEIELMAGTIGSPDGAVTKAADYTITFKETGANQNVQQGQNFKAKVTCAATLKGDTVYYTHGKDPSTTKQEGWE